MQEHASDYMPWCSQHTGCSPGEGLSAFLQPSGQDRTGRPYGVLSLAPMGDRLDNINTAEAQLQAMQYT